MAKRHNATSVPPAFTRTVRREDGVVFTEMVGVANGALIEAMHRDVVPLVRGARWLVDTRGVPSFTPDLAVPATRFLGELRGAGVGTIVAIVTNPMVRMMGRSLCFAAGVKLVAVETPLEAEREIEALRFEST